MPSADLAERIKTYVAGLASRAKPVVRGVAAGQALNVHYPVRPDADRNILTGFVQHESNPLLMAAFLDADHLAARLFEVAMEGSISQGEHDRLLHALRQQLIELRYDEEAAVSQAIDDGADVIRNGPAWAVLMVAVEHEQQVAA